MKKVGIVTLIGYTNYGNRLQNYALQEVLRDRNFSTDTLLMKESFYCKYSKQIKGFLLKFSFVVSFYNWITGRQVEVIGNRESKFKDFSKKYIQTKVLKLNSKKGQKYIQNIDYFFVGSDQVWNPEPWLENELAFLTFCPKEKRMAYAASFGVEEIPKEKRSAYAEGLTGFSFLSVRERSGQKIVKELTGREAKLFLDPTLMLHKNQWIKIETPVKINEPYLLSYFLGETETNFYQILNECRMKNKRNRIEILELHHGQKIWNMTGPGEFLYLIHHAEFVFTDSFHGVVFSILFHKDFYAFRGSDGREKWFDRIQTLLDSVGMSDRIYEKGKTEIIEKISEERWKLCDEYLEGERKKISQELEYILER